MSELDRFADAPPNDDAILVRYPFTKPPLLAHVVIRHAEDLLVKMRQASRAERRAGLASVDKALQAYAVKLRSGRATPADHRNAADDLGIWWVGEYLKGEGAGTQHVLTAGSLLQRLGIPTAAIDVRGGQRPAARQRGRRARRDPRERFSRAPLSKAARAALDEAITDRFSRVRASPRVLGELHDAGLIEPIRAGMWIVTNRARTAQRDWKTMPKQKRPAGSSPASPAFRKLRREAHALLERADKAAIYALQHGADKPALLKAACLSQEAAMLYHRLSEMYERLGYEKEYQNAHFTSVGLQATTGYLQKLLRGARSR